MNSIFQTVVSKPINIQFQNVRIFLINLIYVLLGYSIFWQQHMKMSLYVRRKLKTSCNILVGCK